MAENADFETTLGVVADFFELTRPESILEKLTALAGQIREKTAELTASSAPSRAATS